MAAIGSRSLVAVAVIGLVFVSASPLATQAASPEPSSAASVIPEPTAGVAVTVRAGGEPCRWELGCLAGITLTPLGTDVPALEGTIDPSAEPASPEGSLQATLATGHVRRERDGPRGHRAGPRG